MRFCGRVTELEQIIARWEMASAPDTHVPQLVVIKAERGVGKTRLAIEFFKWLSAQHETPYWPPYVQMLGQRFDLNPDPYACKYDAEIPFLWWGLRGADTAAENSIAGDAVATYDRFLAPHLVALKMRARMVRSGKALLDVWRDVALGEAANWSGYDTVMSVGVGLIKTADILRGSTKQPSGYARDAAADQSLSRIDAVMADLESVFHPRSMTYAKTPGVILIDDAQFAGHDASLPVFLERLLHTAMSQSWPVLIFVTHWRRDLSAAFPGAERSFAGILRHGLEKGAHENGPAASLPGGFLNSGNTHVIDLPTIDDLSAPLADAFPGLPPDQTTALMAQAGGNPRLLEQIIAFLQENEDFFEDFDTERALTDEGLAEALRESHDIFKVVMRRLRDAPVEVQEAICLASLQGVQFVTYIVDELARAHLNDGRSDALHRAGDPYSMVVFERRAAVAEFAERLFFDVAQRRRKSLRTIVDDAGLTKALKQTLRSHLIHARAVEIGEMPEEALLLGLAVRTFNADKPDDLAFRLEALARLTGLEDQRHAFEAAFATAQNTVTAIKAHPDIAISLDPKQLMTCVAVLRRHGANADGQYILSLTLPVVEDAVDENPTIDAVRNLGLVVSEFGQFAVDMGKLDDAEAYFQRLAKVMKRATVLSLDAESLRDEAIVHWNIARLENDRGHSDAAKARAAQAMALARQSAALDPSDAFVETLAGTIAFQGKLLSDRGEFDAAKAALEEAIALRLDGRTDHADLGPVQLRAIAVNWFHLAQLKLDEGLRGDAIILFNRCLTVGREIAQSGVIDDMHYLALVLSWLGGLDAETGDYDQALAKFEERHAVAQEIWERHPTTEITADYVLSAQNLGSQLELAGDIDRATSVFQTGLDVARQTVATSPTLSGWHAYAAIVANAGAFFGQNGLNDKAMACHRDGQVIVVELEKVTPGRANSQRILTLLTDLGGLAAIIGRHDLARQDFRKAQDLARRLVDEYGFHDDRRLLSHTLMFHADAAEASGDHETEIASSIEATDILRTIAQEVDDQQSLIELSNVLSDLATRFMDLKQEKIVHDYRHEAFEVAHKLVRRSSNPTTIGRFLSCSYEWGTHLEDQDDSVAAEAVYDPAIALVYHAAFEDLPAEDVQNLAMIIFMSAQIAVSAGDKPLLLSRLRRGERLLDWLPPDVREEFATPFQELRDQYDAI